MESVAVCESVGVRPDWPDMPTRVQQVKHPVGEHALYWWAAEDQQQQLPVQVILSHMEEVLLGLLYQCVGVMGPDAIGGRVDAQKSEDGETSPLMFRGEWPCLCLLQSIMSSLVRRAVPLHMSVCADFLKELHLDQTVLVAIKTTCGILITPPSRIGRGRLKRLAFWQ